MAMPLASPDAVPSPRLSFEHFGMYTRAIGRAVRLRPVVVAGRCRVAGHVGEPVWSVSSVSHPGRWHLVWLSAGRLACGCEARKRGAFVCVHAAAVRLALVAAAVPAPVASPTPSAGPSGLAAGDDPDPDPDPPSPSSPASPVCPVCGGPAEADEIEELGACLPCTLPLALHPRIPVCVRCGARAYGETREGPLCSGCIAARGTANAQARAAIDEANRQLAADPTWPANATWHGLTDAEAEAIIASEKERQAGYRKNGRGDDPRKRQPPVRRTLRAQTRQEEREESRRQQPDRPAHETPNPTNPRRISIFRGDQQQ